MKIIYEPPAQQELVDATRYYSERSAALSDHFVDALDAAVMRILDRPRAWPPVGKRLRRYILTDFPYQLVYEVAGDTVYVYAFAHLSRRPSYWRGRVPPKPQS